MHQLDALRQFPQAEGLRDEEVSQPLASGEGNATSGGQQHGDGAVMSVDPASKAQPIHGPGHIDIAHHNINRFARDKYRDGLRRIRGFDHRVAGYSQVLRDSSADQDLILDHQNDRLAGVTLCRRRVWARWDHYGCNDATAPWVPKGDSFAKYAFLER